MNEKVITKEQAKQMIFLSINNISIMVIEYCKKSTIVFSLKNKILRHNERVKKWLGRPSKKLKKKKNYKKKLSIMVTWIGKRIRHKQKHHIKTSEQNKNEQSDHKQNSPRNKHAQTSNYRYLQSIIWYLQEIRLHWTKIYI